MCLPLSHNIIRLLCRQEASHNLHGDSYLMYHTEAPPHVWLMVCSWPLVAGMMRTRLLQPCLPFTLLIRNGSTLESCHLSVPLWTHSHCQKQCSCWLMGVAGRWHGSLLKVSLQFNEACTNRCIFRSGCTHVEWINTKEHG